MRAWCPVLLAALILLAPPGAAQSAGGTAGAGALTIDWHTIDAGGGVASGSDLVMSGTIGQPDPVALAGADLKLTGGFWPGHGSGPFTCAADLTGDGVVAVSDLLILLGAWGTPGGDVTGDGATDVADLLALLAAWGSCEGQLGDGAG
jgi:hypothetical protein